MFRCFGYFNELMKERRAEKRMYMETVSNSTFPVLDSPDNAVILVLDMYIYHKFTATFSLILFSILFILGASCSQPAGS